MIFHDIPDDIPYLVSFPTHHLDIYWGLSTINHPFRVFSIYGTPSLAIRNGRTVAHHDPVPQCHFSAKDSGVLQSLNLRVCLIQYISMCVYIYSYIVTWIMDTWYTCYSYSIYIYIHIYIYIIYIYGYESPGISMNFRGTEEDETERLGFLEIILWLVLPLVGWSI